MRSVLALLVVWPLLRIKKRIEESLGRTTAIWFTLITVSQFHFVFYLSRTLPNTMALILGRFQCMSFVLTWLQLNCSSCSAVCLRLVAQSASWRVYHLFGCRHHHLPCRTCFIARADNDRRASVEARWPIQVRSLINYYFELNLTKLLLLYISIICMIFWNTLIFFYLPFDFT